MLIAHLHVAANEFDRHFPVEVGIIGRVDHTHPTLAEFLEYGKSTDPRRRNWLAEQRRMNIVELLLVPDPLPRNPRMVTTYHLTYRIAFGGCPGRRDCFVSFEIRHRCELIDCCGSPNDLRLYQIPRECFRAWVKFLTACCSGRLTAQKHSAKAGCATVTPMSEASDLDLLEAWRGGDKTAGTQLFKRHYDRVARFFANKTGPEHHSELIQRTFLACVEARDRFQGTARFSTYLTGIALRQLYKHYDRNRRERERYDYETVSAEDLNPSPSQVVARQDEYRLLLAALRRIPLEYQIILELVYWEDYTAARVAELLTLPLGTAKTRIRRGRQLLQKQLETLASTPALLESTLMNLEGWAKDLRKQVVTAK